MTNNRPTLPDFKAPPVIEVALGIQFEPLTALDAVMVGKLWSLFRDEYPSHEMRPMLAAVFESFDPPAVEELMLPLGMESPPARCWFVSSDGTSLVQVQVDRLVLNWRQHGGKGTYPRYEKVREHMVQAMSKFRTFAQSEKLGDVVPNQCEVTYVNHLDQGQGWTKPSEAAAVFPSFSGNWSSEFLPEPEDVRAALRFVIPSPGQGKPLGRLHANVETRYRRANKEPLLALTLTARTRPMAEDMKGAFDSLDLGREWIVRAFAALTSKKMHDAWGRCDV